MIDWDRLKPLADMDRVEPYQITSDFANIDIEAGEYIHTKKQFEMAQEIIKDISWGEEPHALAEFLDFPVTTVKSFLKKLRDEEVVETLTIEHEGQEFIAVDPKSGAYALKPSTKWAAFKKEFQKLKREKRFK